MRKIIFRGKSRDTQDWVFGNLIRYPNGRIMIRVGFEDVDVEEETVGEYIGMEDDNGKGIFENDIIRCSQIYDYGATTQTYWFVVEYGVCSYCMSCTDEGYNGFYGKLVQQKRNKTIILPSCLKNERGDLRYWQSHSATFEVVGNIYDNPFLMGEC